MSFWSCLFRIFIFIFSLFNYVLLCAGSHNQDNLLSGIEGYYAGGNKTDEINGIAVDIDGNIIVVGTTNSTSELIKSGTYQTSFGGGESDAFVIKYSSTGTILWSTYFGSTGNDIGCSVKCLTNGNIIICGGTTSDKGIAAGSAFQSSIAGSEDAFIACFDKNGSIIWSSYFGGSQSDVAMDLDIDTQGNIYICGTTSSNGLATTGASQSSLIGATDGFILKLNNNGGKVWSTYFGGEDIDSCKGIAIFNNNIAITGYTTSKSGISTKSTWQDTLGGLSDAFVAQFQTDGTLLWSTYYGGYKDDYGNDVAYDSKGNIYVTGLTTSRQGLTTANTYQEYLYGGIKSIGAFIGKFSHSGKLLFGTYYGGSKDGDYGKEIICDSLDNIFMVGCAKSSIFYSSNAYQKSNNGGYDVIAVKFNPAFNLIWSTYFGGSDDDLGNAIVCGPNNSIFIGGKTSSSGNISSVNSMISPPDGFLASLESDGNVSFKIKTSISYLPLKVTLQYQESKDKWLELAEETVTDTTTYLVSNIRNRETIYKVTITPIQKKIFNPYELIIPNRDSLLSIKSIEPFFRLNNSVLDSNSIGNISFFFTNNGTIGLNTVRGIGGLMWPRGSQNQYIFGSGVWIGAMKRKPNSDTLSKFVEVSYNPNSGRNWFGCGRFEDTDPDRTQFNIKYSASKSVNYNRSTGKNLTSLSDPAWPLWRNYSSEELKRFGAYIYNFNERSNEKYNNPVFLSDEDICCVYNDLETGYFEGVDSVARANGYPLGLQFEQNIYTWAGGDLKDAMIVSYKMINISNDTLMNCWFAPVIDYDIAVSTSAATGATNDRFRFYNKEKELQLIAHWSDTDKGELGHGFGYMGLSFIQTPAVGDNGFLRKDKSFYSKSEQLGLKTYHIWPIVLDVTENVKRYDYMAQSVIDDSCKPADLRAMLATGPFNLFPHDTVKVAYLINFAKPYKGSEADGSIEDMDDLVTGKKAADAFWYKMQTEIYDNNSVSDFLTLEEPYPNPVSGKYRFKFRLPDNRNVTFELVDLLGNTVRTVIRDRYFVQGSHTIEDDLSGLPSGQYYIMAKIGESVYIKKILVVK